MSSTETSMPTGAIAFLFSAILPFSFSWRGSFAADTMAGIALAKSSASSLLVVSFFFACALSFSLGWCGAFAAETMLGVALTESLSRSSVAAVSLTLLAELEWSSRRCLDFFSSCLGGRGRSLLTAAVLGVPLAELVQLLLQVSLIVLRARAFFALLAASLRRFRIWLVASGEDGRAENGAGSFARLSLLLLTSFIALAAEGSLHEANAHFIALAGSRSAGSWQSTRKENSHLVVVVFTKSCLHSAQVEFFSNLWKTLTMKNKKVARKSSSQLTSLDTRLQRTLRTTSFVGSLASCSLSSSSASTSSFFSGRLASRFLRWLLRCNWLRCWLLRRFLRLGGAGAETANESLEEFSRLLDLGAADRLSVLFGADLLLATLDIGANIYKTTEREKKPAEVSVKKGQLK